MSSTYTCNNCGLSLYVTQECNCVPDDYEFNESLPCITCNYDECVCHDDDYCPGCGTRGYNCVCDEGYQIFQEFDAHVIEWFLSNVTEIEMRELLAEEIPF